MSQVFYEPQEQPLSKLVELVTGFSPEDAGTVVVVRHTGKQEVFRRVVMPRETHYEKASETEYVDYVYLFEVEKVLYGGAGKVKPGGILGVYDEPAYDLESTRAFHEEGLSVSPIVMEHLPNHPVSGDHMILFIIEAEIDGKRVWTEFAREGLAAETEIAGLLRARKK